MERLLLRFVSALAAGCTVVLRPASQTPLSALGHKIVAEMAGIPDECFQVVISRNSRETGPLMFEDERIKAVSFTGSTDLLDSTFHTTLKTE